MGKGVWGYGVRIPCLDQTAGNTPRCIKGGRKIGGMEGTRQREVRRRAISGRSAQRVFGRHAHGLD